MDFTFSEDQLLFQESVRDFLVNEVTPERIRASWDSATGRDDALWSQLAELGLTGITVPEEHGGLGMSEVDFARATGKHGVSGRAPVAGNRGHTRRHLAAQNCVG